MYIQLILVWLVLNSTRSTQAARPLIKRQEIVNHFNVRRNGSSSSTPLQVGNGNFAFGADITGLQTFQPFAIMSTWAWHNFSLPVTLNQTLIDGECLFNLDRTVRSSNDH